MHGVLRFDWRAQYFNIVFRQSSFPPFVWDTEVPRLPWLCFVGLHFAAGAEPRIRLAAKCKEEFRLKTVPPRASRLCNPEILPTLATCRRLVIQT